MTPFETMTQEEFDLFMEEQNELCTPSPELVESIKAKLKEDRALQPEHLFGLFPDEEKVRIENGWFQAIDTLAFEEVVVKNEKNNSEWCLHYFWDIDGNRVIVPINGWTGYEVGDDGVLTFNFGPGIYHDDRTSVSIRYKDFDSAMAAKENFIEHFGK